MFVMSLVSLFHWNSCTSGFSKSHKLHQKSWILPKKYWSRRKTKQGGFVELNLIDIHIKKYLESDHFWVRNFIFTVKMNRPQNYDANENTQWKLLFAADGWLQYWFFIVKCSIMIHGPLVFIYVQHRYILRQRMGALSMLKLLTFKCPLSWRRFAESSTGHTPKRWVQMRNIAS